MLTSTDLPHAIIFNQVIESFTNTQSVGIDVFKKVRDSSVEIICQKLIECIDRGYVSILPIPYVKNLSYWENFDNPNGDFYRNLTPNINLINLLKDLCCLDDSDLLSNYYFVQENILSFSTETILCRQRAGKEQIKLVLTIPACLCENDPVWTQVIMITTIYYMLWHAYDIWGDGLGLCDMKIVDLKTDLFTGWFVLNHAPEVLKYCHYKNLAEKFTNSGKTVESLLQHIKFI